MCAHRVAPVPRRRSTSTGRRCAVEHTTIGTSPASAVKLVNSRFEASGEGSAKWLAIFDSRVRDHRAGWRALRRVPDPASTRDGTRRTSASNRNSRIGGHCWRWLRSAGWQRPPAAAIKTPPHHSPWSAYLSTSGARRDPDRRVRVSLELGSLLSAGAAVRRAQPRGLDDAGRARPTRGCDSARWSTACTTATRR